MPGQQAQQSADVQPDNQPDDLVLQADAAELTGKSISTIRSWLRSGRLCKYRETPGNDHSRVLVSRSELLTVAGLPDDACSGTVNPRKRPRQDGDTSPSATSQLDQSGIIQAMQATIDAHTATIDVLRATLAQRDSDVDARDAAAQSVREALSQAAEAQSGRADAERRRADELARELAGVRDELEVARADAIRLNAELGAMREVQGRSWWHRLLPG